MITPTLFAATAIILLSFVSEDAATISSALSIFGGPISWPLGFAACFTGIWLGDLGLYSLARCAGKNVLRSRWLARLADPATITRCEKTFAQNSAFTLIATRFIPGTRLPTYLAAGLFAMPARRFALITAIGALLWISVCFSVWRSWSEKFSRYRFCAKSPSPRDAGRIGSFGRRGCSTFLLPSIISGSPFVTAV